MKSDSKIDILKALLNFLRGNKKFFQYSYKCNS